MAWGTSEFIDIGASWHAFRNELLVAQHLIGDGVNLMSCARSGAGQFQDRVFRGACGRVGWAYVGGMRRSTNDSQGLLDAPCLCVPGAPRDTRRGRSPGRTRSNRLA